MEIADIINNVRFARSDGSSTRSQSVCGNSDTSIVLAARSTPESFYSSPRNDDSHEDATYKSVLGYKSTCGQFPQDGSHKFVQQQPHTPPRRRGSSTVFETRWPQPSPRQRPYQPRHNNVPVLAGEVSPPAYFSAHMNMPPLTRPVPVSGPHRSPTSTLYSQHDEATQAHPGGTLSSASLRLPPHRGVRLPPLPAILRRTRPIPRTQLVRPKATRKQRARVQSAAHEYDDLSTEEALQELARRNIHIVNPHLGDALSKTNLIRLLQRADRNNNKGSGICC